MCVHGVDLKTSAKVAMTCSASKAISKRHLYASGTHLDDDDDDDDGDDEPMLLKSHYVATTAVAAEKEKLAISIKSTSNESIDYFGCCKTIMHHTMRRRGFFD